MSDSFVYELPMIAPPMKQRILGVRFNAARFVYCTCLQEALKRLDLAKQSSFWKEARKTSRGKQKSSLFQQALKFYHFSEYEIHSFVKGFVKECWIKDHIDSSTAQKTASRAFQSANEYRLGKRGRPRFKSIQQFNMVESKSNATGIRFRNGKIHWMGTVFDLMYDPSDEVEKHALHHQIKYVRLVRRVVKGKERYSAQLVLEGKPLIKEKHKIAKGKSVGLDIGPSTLAATSEDSSFLVPLNPKKPKKQKRLQRALDRSRRTTNPENFHENGTAKRNVKWKRSARYKRKKIKLSEEKRKEASERKRRRGEIANKVLSMGTTIKTEKLSYSGFQKQFGRSVARHAPGAIIQTLRLKAENAGGEVVEFSCYKTKLSQICHDCNRVKKKHLNERWHICTCGVGPIQRDLYSSFLALHVEDEVVNKSQANKAWACAEPLMRQALFTCDQAAKGEQRFACFGFSQRQSSSPV